MNNRNFFLRSFRHSPVFCGAGIVLCLLVALARSSTAQSYGNGGSAQNDDATANLCHPGDVNSCVTLCNRGVAKACAVVGGIFLIGDHVQSDATKALQFYQKACDGGVAHGCYELGGMYRVGLGVQQPDKAKAVQLYQKACDGGDADGCDAVSMAYKVGIGVQQNVAKAQEYHDRAASLRSGPPTPANH